MADIRSKLNILYSLEQLSAGDTVIHRIHSLAKLAVTVTYLGCILSLGRYDLARLAPYLFYPILVMSIADVPYGMIFRRTLTALPFCLFAGVSNLILERTVLLHLGGIPVTAGLLSLTVLLLRTVLCVSAVLILIAFTPFPVLMDQLRRLHVPELFVTLLEMVYRYTGVLVEEAVSMVTAFRLRSNGSRWPSIHQFGAFIGQLLLRSADRAERVYQAMQCRCCALRRASRVQRPWRPADWAFLLLGSGSAILFRLFDLVSLLGGLLTW